MRGSVSITDPEPAWLSISPTHCRRPGRRNGGRRSRAIVADPGSARIFPGLSSAIRNVDGADVLPVFGTEVAAKGDRPAAQVRCCRHVGRRAAHPFPDLIVDVRPVVPDSGQRPLLVCTEGHAEDHVAAVDPAMLAGRSDGGGPWQTPACRGQAAYAGPRTGPESPPRSPDIPWASRRLPVAPQGRSSSW